MTSAHVISGPSSLQRTGGLVSSAPSSRTSLRESRGVRQPFRDGRRAHGLQSRSAGGKKQWRSLSEAPILGTSPAASWLPRPLRFLFAGREHDIGGSLRHTGLCKYLEWWQQHTSCREEAEVGESRSSPGGPDRRMDQAKRKSGGGSHSWPPGVHAFGRDGAADAGRRSSEVATAEAGGEHHPPRSDQAADFSNRFTRSRGPEQHLLPMPVPFPDSSSTILKSDVSGRR